MNRFKNILFYTGGADPDGHDLERALNLARVNDARLTVMDVIPEARLASAMGTKLKLDLNQLLRQQRHDELDALLQRLTTDDSAIYCYVRQGNPFIEVVRAVQQNNFDLVMKRARPPGGLREKLFGSTDMHLLRKCPCPVWIERPEADYPYRIVLAAVDPMEPNEAALNRQIMDIATSLAGRESAELHVVHAWWLEWESTLRNGRGRIPEPELDRLLEAEMLARRTRLDALLEPYGLSADAARVHLVKDRAATAIPALAQALDADVIVMGTVGRSGVPGLIIGNTAEDVLQSAHTSVLTVKPAGFESPVLAD